MFLFEGQTIKEYWSEDIIIIHGLPIAVIFFVKVEKEVSIFFLHSKANFRPRQDQCFGKPVMKLQIVYDKLSGCHKKYREVHVTIKIEAVCEKMVGISSSIS